MAIGDIVQTTHGQLGVVKAPYPGVNGAWYVEVWNERRKELIQVAKWDYGLTIVEEAP